jgi:hypothetical protein
MRVIVRPLPIGVMPETPNVLHEALTTRKSSRQWLFDNKTITTEISLQQMIEWLDGFKESAEPTHDERIIKIAKALRSIFVKCAR